LRSFRLKRFEFYANFAKLKRRLRSFHLKCFEVYTNFAKLSTLLSVKFVILKHSSQTLRGVRELCEALNSNKKVHRVRFETLRGYVIRAKLSTLNITSLKFVVAKLSSQTQRGLRELCEALKSDECEIRGCEAFVSNAPRRTRTLQIPQL